jgi:hypothetical protein
MVSIYTICFNLQKFFIFPEEYICVFHMVLTINSINQLGFVAEM